MSNLAIASIVAISFAGMGSPLQSAGTKPALLNLIVVSSRDLTPEKKDSIFLADKLEEAEKLSGASFKLFKGTTYTFLIEENALGTRGLKDQMCLLNVVIDSLAKKQKVISLDQLSQKDADSVRSVMRGHSNQIDQGLRWTVDSPKFRFALEPVVTASFEARGVRMRESALPQKDSSVKTPWQESTKPADQEVKPQESFPANAFKFYFSDNFARPSQRLKAMREFNEIISGILDKEIAEYEGVFDRARVALFEAYGSEMGGSLPPKSSEFTGLPQSLQDTFLKSALGGFKQQGFESEHEADIWFRNSRMISSNPYINIVFGGFDTKRNQDVIGSIVLRRP